MTKQKLWQLSLMLDEYYEEKSKTCEHDCYNCDLGILEGYGNMHSCAIETVMRQVDKEYYS